VMGEKSLDERPCSSLTLSSMPVPKGARKARKRVGRGKGSGLGKTCGKGQKGQTSRSGYKRKAGFEGGQMPIYRRLPKRGFVSRKRVAGENTYALVSLDALERLFEASSKLGVDEMRAKSLLPSSEVRVKVLANGSLTKPLHVCAHAFSRAAKDAIEGAGGSATLL